MAFKISPGVYWNEVDLTNAIPAVSTTVGALAGVFHWGPVGERVFNDSEASFAATWGKPTSFNAETWFTGANFLGYAGGMYTVRAANTVGSNTDIANCCLAAVALANTSATPTNNQLITAVVKNNSDYETKTFVSGINFVARWPGALGNSLKVSVCDSANAYQSTVNLVPNSTIESAQTSIAYVVGSNTATILVAPSGSGSVTQTGDVVDTVISTLTVGDHVYAGNSTVGYQHLKVTAVGAKVTDGSNSSVVLSFSDKFSLSANVSATTFVRKWEYYNTVDRAPNQSLWQTSHGNTAAKDELHVVVADEDGGFTGVPGTVLEVWEGISRSTDAKDEGGRSIYYKNVLNASSKYIWWAADLSSGASANSTAVINSTATRPASLSFKGGQDGQGENDIPLSNLVTAYDLFINADDVDVSLVMQGVARAGTNGTGLANYLISNLAEVRRDCLILISPEKYDVVNAAGTELENLTAFRNSLTSSSYAMLDSGYKYQYDKYNDLYRWIPLNGDIAGLIARTDLRNDAWYSPGGQNRGRVKNVTRLAWNPGSVAIRDVLYKMDVNPVVNFDGIGPVLWGDKTILGRTSAFSHVNVRRLFIVVEKAIAKASAALLFDINDEFTRAQFRNMVEPYLREIQGRRGVYDFHVVCDDTNNTAEVIDTNGFVGDIFIKPARSINTIQLNFVAARTGVEFNEIIGAV